MVKKNIWLVNLEKELLRSHFQWHKNRCSIALQGWRVTPNPNWVLLSTKIVFIEKEEKCQKIQFCMSFESIPCMRSVSFPLVCTSSTKDSVVLHYMTFSADYRWKLLINLISGKYMSFWNQEGSSYFTNQKKILKFKNKISPKKMVEVYIYL